MDKHFHLKLVVVTWLLVSLVWVALAIPHEKTAPPKKVAHCAGLDKRNFGPCPGFKPPLVSSVQSPGSSSGGASSGASAGASSGGAGGNGCK